MTKLKTTLTISAIASILIIGGFAAAPDAYSTYGGWGDDDDDCDDYYGYHHDDCDDEPQTGKIIVRAAITKDNGGIAEPEDVTITIQNTKTGDPEVLAHDNEDPVMNVNEVPAGTYKFTDIIVDDATTSYTTVLITGDNKCPSDINQKFKVKQGKKIECTIYIDDNGDGSGGDGIFFVRNSISFVSIDGATGDCVIESDQITNSPCVKVDGGSLFVADPTLDDPTKASSAIITSTLVQVPKEADGTLSPPECVFSGVTEMNGVVGFALDCGGIQTDESTYNVNYAIIDALGN